MTRRRIWMARFVATVFGGVACLASIGSVGSTAFAQVPAELRGHVSDMHTAQPVAEARIDVEGRTENARTSADGSYVLRGLEPRAYTVRVRAVGYAAREVDVDIVNGETTTLDVALERNAPTLGTVFVRGARSIRDTLGVNATTFDRADIEASHRRDVGELLQSTPGVVVTQAGGAGSATRVSIRGSSSNEVLVLVDGVPMNSSIDGEVDLSTISLESVERVTVRTGAQSARYGGRALAGVIEIETRRAAAEASAQARAGAWGERNASASIGESRAVGDARLGGSLTTDYRTVRGDFPYDVPAVRGGGTARRINAAVESREVLGATSLDGASWGVRARASWQGLARGLAGSIVQPSTTGHQAQARRSVELDGRGQHGMLSWTAAGDATGEHVTFADSAPPFGTKYDDTVDATAFTATASGTLGAPGFAVSLGSEARALDVTSTLLRPGAPTWQRVLGAWSNVRASRLIERTGTRLDAEAGVRADENSLIARATVSPRLSASATHGAVVASASLSAGYAPPSLADEFFHEGVLVKPNPSLRAERTRNDVEARLTLRETAVGPLVVGGQGAVYRADVDGMILWSPDFRFVWSPSNVDVRRSGWEIGGRARTASGLLDLDGSLNRANVEYSGSVNQGQVTYRPRTTGSITLGVSPGPLRVEIVNRYVGERRTVPGSALNALDPYWRTDARVTATMRRPAWSAEATLGLENAFNQPAAMLVDYPFPSRDWTLAIRVRRGSSRDE